MRQLVQPKNEGGTVIYSTHHLAEAQQVCDRIIIVHNGLIQADGTPDELLGLTNTKNIEEAYASLTMKQHDHEWKKLNNLRIFRNCGRLVTPSTKMEVNEDE